MSACSRCAAAPVAPVREISWYHLPRCSYRREGHGHKLATAANPVNANDRQLSGKKKSRTPKSRQTHTPAKATEVLSKPGSKTLWVEPACQMKPEPCTTHCTHLFGKTNRYCKCAVFRSTMFKTIILWVQKATSERLTHLTFQQFKWPMSNHIFTSSPLSIYTVHMRWFKVSLVWSNWFYCRSFDSH